MSFKRMICSAMLGVLAMGLGSQLMAQPIFENLTPTGFSVSDSVSKTDFVTGKEVTVQVDLNEAANFDYPVIGNFQKMERSVPLSSTMRMSQLPPYWSMLNQEKPLTTRRPSLVFALLAMSSSFSE